MEPAGNGLVEQRLRTLHLICAALAFSSALVAGIVFFLDATGSMPEPVGLPDVVVQVLAGVGIFQILLAPALQRSLFKRAQAEGFAGNPAAWLDAYQRAVVVGFAVREATAMLGFVLAILTGTPLFSYALSAAALLSMATGWPRRGHLAAPRAEGDAAGSIGPE